MGSGLDQPLGSFASGKDASIVEIVHAPVAQEETSKQPGRWKRAAQVGVCGRDHVGCMCWLHGRGSLQCGASEHTSAADASSH